MKPVANFQNKIRFFILIEIWHKGKIYIREETRHRLTINQKINYKIHVYFLHNNCVAFLHLLLKMQGKFTYMRRKRPNIFLVARSSKPRSPVHGYRGHCCWGLVTVPTCTGKSETCNLQQQQQQQKWIRILKVDMKNESCLTLAAEKATAFMHV